MATDDELRHYGVVGMKWGVRKERHSAKRAARLSFKADKQLSNSKSSMTSWRRKANKKAYEKTTAKLEQEKQKISKDAYENGVKQVAKFRGTAYSVMAAGRSTYKVAAPFVAGYSAVTLGAIAATTTLPPAAIASLGVSLASGVGTAVIRGHTDASAYQTRRDYYKKAAGR